MKYQRMVELQAEFLEELQKVYNEGLEKSEKLMDDISNQNEEISGIIKKNIENFIDITEKDKQDILKQFKKIMEYIAQLQDEFMEDLKEKEEEIVEKIKDKFKTWEAKEANINTTEPKFNPCIIKKNKDIEQVNLAINLKAIPMISDREVYALSVVNNVFGGSISSRLFQKIREEKGLVYSIYSSQTLYQECGELGIFASTSNENVEEVYKLILDEIDLIRNEYISLQEIHESKEQLKGSYMLDRESTSSRMMSNGKNLLMRNKVDDEQDIIDYINAVEYDDVVKIIKKVFNTENMGVCIVGKDVENINL